MSIFRDLLDAADQDPNPEPYWQSVLALLLMILAVGAWLYIGSAL